MALSVALDAEVVLAHALCSDALGRVELNEAFDRAGRVRRRGEAQGGRFSPTLVLRFEDPGTFLLLTATEMAADLIVIGAPTGAGAVARKIVVESPCPVWFARGPMPTRFWSKGSAPPILARLGVAPVSKAEASREDLLVIDSAHQAVLSRVQSAQEALAECEGPVLVQPRRSVQSTQG